MPKKNKKKLVKKNKAPLVQPDRWELGDHRLDPTESVEKQREELLAMASRNKIGGQAELEDAERGSGPRLQFTEIISRLRLASPEIRAVDGSPGNIALYYPRNSKEYLEAKQEWDYQKDEFFLFHKYVGGFPKQEIPEYSTIDIDTSHLPTKENRGWRSILITLLKQGALSYGQAVHKFGDVGMDRRGWRWREQTEEWRRNAGKKFTQSNSSETSTQ